jgi:hypothetical protein
MTEQKTFDECLEEAENKYSRKVGGLNVDCLYPILNQIIKEGTKIWLTQKRQDENHLDDVSFLFYQGRQPEKKIFEKGFKCTLDELLEDLKK